MEKSTLENALPQLKSNLTDVARVFEWARLMGFEDPKEFSEKFLRHYGVRPQKIMELVRLESIVRYLRSEEEHSNLKVARLHSLPCEKTLNNFTNYHTGYSPTDIKNMSANEVEELLENMWSNLMEEYAVAKVWNAANGKLS